MQIQEQLSLIADSIVEATQFAFDGKTFEAPLDGKRLNRQLDAVRDLMLDGEWRTLPQIAKTIKKHFAGVSVSEAGISARLRDLRKARFGGFQVESKRIGANGSFEYRVIPERTV